MAETLVASATRCYSELDMIPLRDNIRSTHFPIVNTALIVACISVSLYQLIVPQMIETWAFRPVYITSLNAIRELGGAAICGSLVLSLFMHAPLLHGGVLHLGFNMLFLWVFGDNVEDRMGHLRYLIFYLVCGILATLAHSLITLFGALVTNPQGLAGPLIGASGAIAGILGAYYKLFRGATVRTLVFLFIFITTVDLPASLFIIIWFVLQLLSGLGALGGAGGGVAFWAHIGGFVAGLYLVRLFVPRRRPPRGPRVLPIRRE